jgi:hypothetical protein
VSPEQLEFIENVTRNKGVAFMDASLQRRSDSACPGHPAESEGTPA